MNIIGAGMAGLLAANILRRHEPIVFESGPSLPNNHHALLRFRSDVVSKATGIPFRKVNVSKAIYFDGKLHDKPTIAFNNMYSRKVTGGLQDRSISSLDTVERYIAPPDFIQRLAAGVHIQYGLQWNPTNHIGPSVVTISTIPMPTLMGMVDWIDRPKFASKNIRVVEFDIDGLECDLYQTIYYPHPDSPEYRASITGKHVMIEFAHDDSHTQSKAYLVMKSFGINITTDQMVNFQDHVQQYGKIAPVPKEKRQEFILAMTDKFRVYSLGRFATWRQILLDDLIEDIDFIDRSMTQRDSYSQHLQFAREM